MSASARSLPLCVITTMLRPFCGSAGVASSVPRPQGRFPFVPKTCPAGALLQPHHYKTFPGFGRLVEPEPMLLAGRLLAHAKQMPAKRR